MINNRSNIKIATIVLLLVGWLATSKGSPAIAEKAVKLVSNGQPVSVIVISPQAAVQEQQAAQELTDYLEKISGGKPETAVVAEAGISSFVQAQHLKGYTVILIGDCTPKKAMCSQGEDPASFIIKADNGLVCISGLSPEGTLYGAYELLEQLGVRWFMPGEIGTVIPRSPTVSLKKQNTIQIPSFAGRWFWGKDRDPWQRRVRMGGPYFPSAHGLRSIRREDFEKHPEYFALKNGQRVNRQLCISNPEVVKLAVEEVRSYFRANPDAPWYGMGPNDGSGFCECADCRALDGDDWDPFEHEISVTDRYVWLFNQVLENIKDEFPDKKICFYVYHAYMRPPVKIKPDPHIVPAFAPISLCRIHGMNNPICPERSYYKLLIESWNKLLPEVYERGYWFNLADPGFPFSQVHKMRDEILTAKTLGIAGWRVETKNHWGSETPSLYIAAKLMWDHTADVETLLKDFYEKFFGPAARPMSRYGELMDTALRTADYHTGSSYDLPHIYPLTLRNKARKLLQEAAAGAGGGIYGKRVDIFRDTFDYLEAFIDMQKHRNRFDFVAAKKDLDRVDALREKLVSYQPSMVNPKAAESYLRRFFRICTEQGYKRVTAGNKIVAALNDEWDFLLDPQGIGEDIGLYRDRITGGNWQKLKTSSLSWGDQGLRTYKGEAWYRQQVEIPRKFVGKRIFLWFGGVDEKAKVWVNGHEVGISHTAAFVPFEMDVTEMVLSGRKNVVTVRVLNDHLNELGTGGITAPVMFWAPAAGRDAVPENVRELQKIFP